MFKTEKEAMEALQNTIQELDQLQKSWNKGLKKSEGEEEEMAKAEGDEPDPQAPGAGAPPPAPEMQGAPQGDEGAPAPEGQDDGAPAPEGDMGAEGQDEGGDMMAQIAQEASSLSDEELDMLLHALMSEKDGRHAGGGDDGQGAPPPEGDMGDQGGGMAPPQEPMEQEPEQKSLAMSMKEEFKKLNKSFNDQVASLRKSVDGLKAENAQLRRASQTPTSKPAASNKVEVLQKSAPKIERLNKSETLDFLMGQVRSGNRNVNRDDVAMANACKNDADLQYVHDSLKSKGIEVPVKK